MDLLGVRSLPFLARRNYYHEFKQILPWSVTAGLVEGQFGSVIVAKVFGGSEAAIALATTTPVAAFMTSLVWGMLCVGRPKATLLVAFTTGTALIAGLAALIPAEPSGVLWFILQMGLAQVLLTGVITVRSAVWKSNYPKSVRGRITARLQAVRFVVGAITALAAAAACDRDPSSYRVIYPLIAVAGLLAAWRARYLRIRGEKGELRRREGDTDEVNLREGLAEPFSLTALISPGHVLGQMREVLREDRWYRRYCLAQSFSGTANLMTVSIAAAVVTRELDFGYAWGFWVSTGLLVAVPQLVTLASLGRWGRLFDRVGVLGFRVINVGCWLGSLLMGMFGTLVVEDGRSMAALALPLAVVLFAGRGIFYGLARGGGAVAWYIGHLHFARPEKAEIYMGIHVFLTGLRGLVAPIAGVLLWQWIGWPAWLFAIALSLTSFVLYYAMAKEERGRASHDHASSDMENNR